MTDERAEPRGGSSSQCAARKAREDGFHSEYRFDLRLVQRVRVLKKGENPCHYFELCVLWLRMYLCMCLRRPRQGCEEKRTSLIARKKVLENITGREAAILPPDYFLDALFPTRVLRIT
jgi:hypothetical protein